MNFIRKFKKWLQGRDEQNACQMHLYLTFRLIFQRFYLLNKSSNKSHRHASCIPNAYLYKLWNAFPGFQRIAPSRGGGVRPFPDREINAPLRMKKTHTRHHPLRPPASHRVDTGYTIRNKQVPSPTAPEGSGSGNLPPEMKQRKTTRNIGMAEIIGIRVESQEHSSSTSNWWYQDFLNYFDDLRIFHPCPDPQKNKFHKRRINNFL